jgi:hypothetical protein
MTDDNTLRFNVTVDSAQLKKLQQTTGEVVSGIKKELQTLTGFSSAELFKMVGAIKKTEERLRAMAEAMGDDTSVAHLRQVVKEINAIEKAAAVAAVEQKKQMDALTRGVLAFNQQRLRTEQTTSKQIQQLRDQEHNRWMTQIQQENKAGVQQADLLIKQMDKVFASRSQRFGGGAAQGGVNILTGRNFGVFSAVAGLGGLGRIAGFGAAGLDGALAEGGTSGGAAAVAGGLVAGVAIGAIIAAITAVKKLLGLMFELGKGAVKVAADFEVFKNAITLFAGSAAKAEAEIAALHKTALSVPGLAFESAEGGYQKLRALGFAAETARGLIAGLAKQRIISGADEHSIERVIVNLTQLSAGSSRAAQDLREIFHQLPSLRPEFFKAFGTLDPQKIGREFTNDSENALKKLSAQLEKTKTVQGGLNTAVIDFDNIWKTVQRDFGEPILEPAAKALKDLSKDLYANRDIFIAWGQTVGSVLTLISRIGETRLFSLIRLIDRVGKAIGSFGGTELVDGGKLRKFLDDYNITTKGKNYITGETAEDRARKSAAAFYDRYTNSPGAVRSDFTIDFSKPIESAQERDQRLADEDFKRQIKVERERQRQLDGLKSFTDAQQAIDDSYYKVQEARLKSHLTHNKNQEIAQVKQLTAIEVAAINARIANENYKYNKLIQLNEGNVDKITEINNEHSATIYKLENEKTIALLKQDAELARKREEIAEQSRQAQIKANELTLQAVQAHYQRQLTLTERFVSQSTDLDASGYNDLVKLSNEFFTEQIRLNKVNLDLQLQDKKLTAEQSANITREANLREKQLTNEAADAFIDITTKKYDAAQKRVEAFYKRIIDIRTEGGTFVDKLFGLLTPGRAGLSSEADLRGVSGVDLENEQIRNLTAKYDALTVEIKKRQAEARLLTDAEQQSFVDRSRALDKEAKSILNLLPESVAVFDELLTKLYSGKAETSIFDQIAKEALAAKKAVAESNLVDTVTYLKREIALEEQSIRNQVAEYRKDDANKPLEGYYKIINENGTERLRELQHQLGLTEAQMNTLRASFKTDEIDQFGASTEGLRLQLEKLRNDPITQLGEKDKLEKASLLEQINTQKEIFGLQYKIAHAGEDAAARYQKAWLSAIYEVKDASIQAAETQIKAQVRISDQTVFHADRARAIILDQIANSKGLTEIFADGFLQLSANISDGIGSLLTKATEKLGAFGQTIANIATQLLTMVTNRLLMRLVDAILPATGGANTAGVNGGAGGGGNIFGNIFGTIFGGIFGGGNRGGGGGGSNPFFSGLGGSSSNLLGNLLGGGGGSNLTPGDLFSQGGGGGSNPFFLGLPRNQAAAAAGGNAGNGAAGVLSGLFNNFSLKGLGKSLGAAAPLLGFSLGSAVGGSSITGSLLGGAGGLIGGGVLSALIGGSLTGGTTGGIFGSIGGLLGIGAGATAGIALAIAPLLLLGGFFLGRDKLRKKEEKIRAQEINGALGQLDEILKNLRAHKYGSGQEAIDAAYQVRDTYRQNVSQLKDRKTRNIALKEINDRINPKILQIEAAAKKLDEDRKYFNDLVPEFATGGIVPGQRGVPRLVLAHGGELIANLGQQTPQLMNAAANAGIPGVGGGAGGGSTSNQPIHVELHVGKKAQNELWINGAKSNGGFNVLISQNSKSRRFEERSENF